MGDQLLPTLTIWATSEAALTLQWAILLFIFIGIHPAEARPIWELHVKEPLTVFIEPNELTKELVRLSSGQVVVISPRIYNGFRLVLIKAGSQRRRGYIPTRKIRLSVIQERGAKPAAALQNAYNSEKAYGVAAFGSYLLQPETGFQESDGLTNWFFSELTSTTFFAALFADLPFSDTLGFRIYLAQRTTAYRGTAIQESLSPTPASGPVKRDQKLIALGSVAKIYPRFGSKWWWGGGLEFAKGTDVKLSLNGIDLITTEDDLPFFMSLFGAVGGDFMLRKRLYLVPDFRMGVITTIQPISFMVEGMVGIAYRF